MSTFENLLLTQTEKQLSILQDQSNYYSEWQKNERKLIDKYIVQENFCGNYTSDLWEAASFHIIDGFSEIKGKWNSINGLCLEEGLYLANRIIRCKELITLKSLAVEIKVEVKLSLNSEVWMVTRGVGIKDPNSAILKISKESEIDGIFIVFGSPIGSNNEFVFFKRQQIPEEKFDPNEEFTNLDIRIKDNGDDRIYVSVKLSTLQSTVFQTYCNKFIPSLIENRVMVAGYGRNVIVKGVSIQQKERSSMGIIIEASKRQQCCSIF
ncbi:hypothetical protein SteCoe_483 [Stentor coeruleus]|uniref:Uncharacterized protein n=1 Tax=Stentor coeruleus TaxID=5963 RepID=A0A1R2D3Y4_9CILI|nr:hypothetical protein SteCoe_483 [Stentor coeruleus]